MAISVHCKATLELGRKLTKELELDRSVDTLGRWMAHYVAELIEDAEKSSGKERSIKMQTCSEAILSLWQHRHELPSGKRPFEELEPILRALQSLDPDDRTPRYFRSRKVVGDQPDSEDETESWLKLVDDLDYSAKALIGYCLGQAAQAGIDKSEEWVALAESASAEDEIEFEVVRFFVDEKDLLNKADPNEAIRKVLQGRIDRLEGFTKRAEDLLSNLKRRVRQLPKAE